MTGETSRAGSPAAGARDGPVGAPVAASPRRGAIRGRGGAGTLGALSGQVRRTRLWLPLAIVGVVLVWQLGVVPSGTARWGTEFGFWAELLFYSILGPTATYATLNWIVIQVRRREAAQGELTRLYTELQSSHALLGAIQKVTERFASASDLEAAMRAATQGIREVTGARGAVVLLGGAGEGSTGARAGVTQASGLDEPRIALARERDRALRSGATPPARALLPAAVAPGEAPPGAAGDGGAQTWILTETLRGGGGLAGSLHAFYDAPPDGQQRESFRILASEFGAAAEAARGRMRDLLTLIEVDRSIRAEGNLERLLATLLEQMMGRVDATLGGVYLLGEGERLQLQVATGARDVGGSLRLGEGLVGTAGASGEPCIAPRLDDAARRGAALLAGAGSAAALPLVSDDGLLGVVVLGHEVAEHFEDVDLPFLELLAGQVSLAVRNARAYLQSEELAIVEERARIAREIHDGVAQSLAFSALKLDLVARLLERDPDTARRELNATKGTIRELIKEVRRSIFALRPIDLERHGFRGTLERYARDFGQQNDVRVELDLGDLPDLDAKGEAVLFRIFQEGMNNVAKHARARTVTVRIRTDAQGRAALSVIDDGIGFDPARVGDRVTSAGGLGLLQMRERIEARGGSFALASTPGEGTRLEAALPV